MSTCNCLMLIFFLCEVGIASLTDRSQRVAAHQMEAQYDGGIAELHQPRALIYYHEPQISIVVEVEWSIINEEQFMKNQATELKFEGIRVQLSSKKTYDRLLASLLEENRRIAC